MGALMINRGIFLNASLKSLVNPYYSVYRRVFKNEAILLDEFWAKAKNYNKREIDMKLASSTGISQRGMTEAVVSEPRAHNPAFPYANTGNPAFSLVPLRDTCGGG